LEISPPARHTPRRRAGGLLGWASGNRPYRTPRRGAILPPQLAAIGALYGFLPPNEQLAIAPGAGVLRFRPPPSAGPAGGGAVMRLTNVAGAAIGPFQGLERLDRLAGVL